MSPEAVALLNLATIRGTMATPVQQRPGAPPSMNRQDPKPGVVIGVTRTQMNDAADDSAETQQAGSDAVAHHRLGRRAGAGGLTRCAAQCQCRLVFGFRYWSDLADEMAAMDACAGGTQPANSSTVSPRPPQHCVRGRMHSVTNVTS